MRRAGNDKIDASLAVIEDIVIVLAPDYDDLHGNAVTGSGLSEPIECCSPRFADQLLSHTVDGGADTCILRVRDATAAEEMQQWRDCHDSASRAIEAAGGASAIVNLRG